MIWTQGRSEHPSIVGQIFWSSVLSTERFAIKRGNDGKICMYWGLGKSEGLNMDEFKFHWPEQPVLWSFRHALYICFGHWGREYTWKSKWVAVVQTAKVKLGGHCIRDFRHVLVLLKTWVFWTVLQTRTKITGGCDIMYEFGYCLYFAELSWSPLCCDS